LSGLWLGLCRVLGSGVVPCFPLPGLGLFPVDVGGRSELAANETVGTLASALDSGQDVGAVHEPKDVIGNDTGRSEDHGPVGLGANQVPPVRLVADLGQVSPAPVVQFDEHLIIDRHAHGTSIPGFREKRIIVKEVIALKG
jgi:hypothetical protein